MDDRKTALARKATELRTARADLQKAREANDELEAAHAAKVKLLEADLAKAKEAASNWDEMGTNLINSSSDYAWRVFLTCQEKAPQLTKEVFDAVPVPNFDGGEDSEDGSSEKGDNPPEETTAEETATASQENDIIPPAV